MLKVHLRIICFALTLNFRLQLFHLVLYRIPATPLQR